MAKTNQSELTAEQLLVDDLADKEQQLSAREAMVAEESRRLEAMQSKVEALAAKVEAQVAGTHVAASEEKHIVSTVCKGSTGVYRVYAKPIGGDPWQVVVTQCCDESEAVRCALASRGIVDTQDCRCTVEKVSA